MKALICIGSNDLEKKMISAVKQVGLNAEGVTNIKEALKRFEYHLYNLVIIDDEFDQNKGIAGIIDSMNTMDMSLRRRICLVWISNKFKTNDNFAALNFSVNAILNQGDISHLDPFLSRTLQDHKRFYMVFNDSLKIVQKQ